VSLPPPPPPPEPDDRRFLEVYGAWDPMTVLEVREAMDGFPEPWWVVGGHAVEAFTGDGVRYMRPEVVLHHKALHRRAKDEWDRDRVLPLLTAERRRWLAEAVRRTYPDHHPWQPLLDDLASGAG